MSESVKLSAVYFINFMPAEEQGIVRRYVEDMVGLLQQGKSSVEIREIRIPNRLALNEFLLDTISNAGQHENGHVTFHIDAHSDRQGIEVNRTLIGWTEFFSLLRPVNIALHGRLSLNLAACKSAWSVLRMDVSKPTPFMAIIAPEVDFSAQDSIEIYRPFYESIFLKRDFSAGIKALRREAKTRNISIFTSTTSRLFWDGIDDFLENHARGQARQLRAENLVTRLNEAGLDGVAMRGKVKARLWADQGPLIRASWRRFSLITIYPDLEAEVRLSVPPAHLTTTLAGHS